MARSNKPRPELYTELFAESNKMGEANDCGVISLAAVTGVTYGQAHKVLKQIGRSDKGACSLMDMMQGLLALGFSANEVNPSDFIRQYPRAKHRKLEHVTTHHPEKFPTIWKNGKKYLFFVRGHVCAVVDGQNIDWTQGRSKRCHKIYEIVEGIQ